MSDRCYGLCDTDSSDEEPVVVGGVSVEGFRSRKRRRGADAASRHWDRMRAIDAGKKRLRRAKESAEQRRLRLEADRLAARRRRAMKRRMAELGEDPVLRFDDVEDNREVPVRFDGVEVVDASGEIGVRCELVPGETRRKVNRDFVARVRANMREEDVVGQREENRIRNEAYRNSLSERERIAIRAENTEFQRVKRCKTREQETRKYEMRFDTTEDEYLRIMGEENVDYDAVFRDSAKNLAKAVHLYYANSGCGENGQYREYDRKWEGKPIDQEDVCRQVDAQKSTCKDYFRMFDEFFSDHSYVDASLLSCGACGYRIRERLGKRRPIRYTRYLLGSDELLPLRYSDEQSKDMRGVQEYYKTNPVLVPFWNGETGSGDLRRVEPWRVISMYDSVEHGLYHLHPELVDIDDSGVESVLLCPYCSDSVKNVGADPLKRVPKFSIAAGIDFGYYKRVGLTEPNLHEEVILGRVRAVIASYKVKSNMCGCRTMTRDKLQCNAVLFCQEEFERLSDMLNGHEMFDEKGLELLLRIFLLDDKGRLDNLVRMAHGRADIMARPIVVVEWITVLIHVHVYYKDLRIPSWDEIIERINRSNDRIMKTATRIDDVRINEVERNVGVDVACVQQVGDELDARMVSCDMESNEDDFNDGTVGVRVTCAIRPPERCLQNDDVYRFARLRSIRNLVGPGGVSFEKYCTEDGDGVDDGEIVGEDVIRFRRQQDELDDIGIDVDRIRERFGIKNSRSEDNPGGTSAFGMCRKGDPVNEFLEPDSVVTAAFPTVFMLGSAYKKPIGRLCGHARHHLLHQFTMVPSRCRRFLLYLFDATSRLASINSVNAYVSKHERARRVIQELLENPKERARLEDAYLNPNSDSAKAFLKKYIPYLRFAASKVGYGLGETSRLETQLKESSKRFQAPASFLTLSFDDTNNPRAIRATFTTVSNRKFPAVFESGCVYGSDGVEFMEKLRRCSDDSLDIGDIGLSESVRSRLAIEDPVTFVSETKEMLVSVCEILLGVQLEHMFTRVSGETTRKTNFFKSSKGVFGYPTCLIGVIEDHAKGTVHFHLLLYGSLTPYLLQRFSSMGTICEKISEVLDTMYCCSLPGEVQLSHVLRRIIEKEQKVGRFAVRIPRFRQAALLERGTYDSVVNVEQGVISAETVLTSVANQCSYLQNHIHMFSCTNSKSGNDGCRYGASWSLVKKTWPRMLVRLTGEEIDTIDDQGCIPSRRVVLGIDHPEDFANENTEDTIIDIDSEAEFSVIDGVSSDGEQVMVGSDSVSGSNIPTEDFEDDLYRGNVPVGMTRAYVCTRDPSTLKPVLAFKAVDQVPLSVCPDKYVWNDPLRREQNRPLVVWELRRPRVALSLPDITAASGCSSLLILQTLHEFLKHTKEFGNWESDFWEDMKMLPFDCLSCLYDTFRDAVGKANGYVSTFNPVISFCTGGHNNASLLGSDQQAKCAMYYISPYLGKNKEVLLHSLGILRGAVHHTETYGSVAPDAEIEDGDKSRKNPRRSIKRVLQRFVNQANLHIELSDYQVAAMLLDVPCIITTECFAYVNPRAQMAYRTFVQMDDDGQRLQDELIDRINEEEDKQMARDFDEEGFIAPESEVDSDDDEEEIDRSTDLPVYNLEDICKGIGYLMPVTFKNGKKGSGGVPVRMLIPKVALYANRGFDLRELNLMEYVALIDKCEKSTTLNTRCKRFEFPPSFVCAAEYEQVLCMKQKTVVVIGKPPGHPGEKPRRMRGRVFERWKREADEYARFYLTLFRPEITCYEVGQENKYRYDWAALEEFVLHLSTDSSVLSKFRLMAMHIRMKGLYTSNDNKIFSGMYRNRSRDLWDPSTKRLIALDKSFKDKEMKNQAKYRERAENEYARLSVVENNNMSKTLANSMELISALRLLPVGRGRRKRELYGTPGYVPTDPLCRMDRGMVQRLGLDLRDAGIEDPNDKCTSIPDDSEYLRHRALEEHRYWLSLFKERQLEVYNVFDAYLQDPLSTDVIKPPAITWLNGGAGCGKSELLKRIIFSCELKGHKCVRTAFNHVNAIHIGGVTTCSLLHFNESDMHRYGNFIKSPWWKEFCDVMGNAVLIVIDEFSNQAPWHLAKFSKACQVLTDKYGVPFGGIPVIFAGDLNQLGPVKAGKSLASAIVDMCLGVWTIPYTIPNPTH